MVDDDNDPFWEPEDDVGSEEEEEMWRADEKLSGLVQLANEKVKREEAQKARQIRELMALFNQWKMHWMRVMARTCRRLDRLESRRAFSREERVVWRLVSAVEGEDDDGWRDLPGPASDWPETFDFRAEGWEVPANMGTQASLVLSEIGGSSPSVNFDTILEALRLAVDFQFV